MDSHSFHLLCQQLLSSPLENVGGCPTSIWLLLILLLGFLSQQCPLQEMKDPLQTLGGCLDLLSLLLNRKISRTVTHVLVARLRTYLCNLLCFASMLLQQITNSLLVVSLSNFKCCQAILRTE